MNKVGFIGLGIMGAPMSRNLMKAGYPVMVFNRSRGPMEAAARDGAEMVESLTQLAVLQRNFHNASQQPTSEGGCVGRGGHCVRSKARNLDY